MLFAFWGGEKITLHTITMCFRKDLRTIKYVEPANARKTSDIPTTVKTWSSRM